MNALRNPPKKSILRRPCGPTTSIYIGGSQPPGIVVCFPGSDTYYEIQRNGSLRRVSRKS
jgi:hypothetical protein